MKKLFLAIKKKAMPIILVTILGLTVFNTIRISSIESDTSDVLWALRKPWGGGMESDVKEILDELGECDISSIETMLLDIELQLNSIELQLNSIELSLITKK
jgi:hypothetical protein